MQKKFFQVKYDDFNAIVPIMLKHVRNELENNKHKLGIERTSKEIQTLYKAAKIAFCNKEIIRFDLYNVFTQNEFEGAISKIKNTVKSANTSEADLRADFNSYCQRLAYKMSDAGLTRVTYNVYGCKFRIQNDWDEYFKPTDRPIDKIIREGSP